MLLTITTTYSPATDLGYLLDKHPDRVQRFNLSVGDALVFYPQADPARCGGRGDRTPRSRLIAFLREGSLREGQPPIRGVDHPQRRVQRALRKARGKELRHRDHRFEWTREEFEAWAGGVAERNDYRIEFEGIGEDDPVTGSSAQMAVFERIMGSDPPEEFLDEGSEF